MFIHLQNSIANSILFLMAVGLVISCENKSPTAQNASVAIVEDTLSGIVAEESKPSQKKVKSEFPSQDELAKIVGAIIEKEQPDLLDYFNEQSKHSIYPGRFITSDSNREQYLVYSESAAYHQGFTEGLNVNLYAVILVGNDWMDYQTIWASDGIGYQKTLDVDKDGFSELILESLRVRNGRLDQQLQLVSLKYGYQLLAEAKGYDLSGSQTMTDLAPLDTLTKSFQDYQFKDFDQDGIMELEIVYDLSFKDANGKAQEKKVTSRRSIPAVKATFN